MFHMTTIKSKLIAAFAALCLGTIGLGLFALHEMSAISNAVKQSNGMTEGAKQAGRLSKLVRQVQLLDLQLHFSVSDENKEKYKAEVAKAHAEYQQAWSDFRAVSETQALDSGTDGVVKSWAALGKLEERVAKFDNAGFFDKATALVMGDLSNVAVSLEKAIDETTDRLDSASLSSGAKAGALADLSRIWTIAVIVASTVLCVLLVSAMSLHISAPLGVITTGMRRLAERDFDAPIGNSKRRDEIGAMVKAVMIFKDNMIERARLEEDAKVAHLDVDRRLKATEEAFAAAGVQQQRVVDDIASALTRLAARDLTVRLDDAFAAEYEKLRADFNAAMEKLQETMKKVFTNTSAIRCGSDEISSAANDLSRRTEQQAASLEETATALDEITATVRKTAEGSKYARNVVGQAKQAAEHSGQVVRQAVDAMNGIEKSSGQIRNIISVIDEIAFQTNLLALNAGVEAARAGDAGRGFAVVASEVRALAQRSADAAKEIKALISASSQQVERGVELVGETGRALEKIVVQVSEINGIVGEIAVAAQEQATGLDQVNTAVNQMDQVTQQNAAMVEQSTAASTALARETEDLAALIGRFEIGRSAASDVSRPARRPAPSVRPAASKSVTALKTTGRTGAARKPEASVGAQEWQEF